MKERKGRILILLRGLIEADFERIAIVKQEITEQVSDLSQTNNIGVTNHLEDIRNIWRDSSKELFTSKENELSGEMQKEILIVENLLEEIGSASERLFNADQRGRMLSSSRNY